jgi:hypothetical protein
VPSLNHGERMSYWIFKAETMGALQAPTASCASSASARSRNFHTQSSAYSTKPTPRLVDNFDFVASSYQLWRISLPNVRLSPDQSRRLGRVGECRQRCALAARTIRGHHQNRTHLNFNIRETPHSPNFDLQIL